MHGDANPIKHLNVKHFQVWGNLPHYPAHVMKSDNHWMKTVLIFFDSAEQGDLGTIDEKYDVAISTACGSLDNIIVDTMDTAVRCVNFLRKQDVGVATFIGLDKMERWKKEAHSKITT